MTTLMIKDLSSSVELDSKAMTAVAGGLYLGRVRKPYWGGAPKLSFSITDIDSKSVIANQDLAQVQNLSTATGVNAAFVDHLKSDVWAEQNGSNNINL